MASSDREASCVNDPNFAVICSFLQTFATVDNIEYPNINEIEKMIENTDEVPIELLDLLIKLLRKNRYNVHKDRVERALIKFCYTYSNQDAWEIERFGYKKARLSVKINVLKCLLESQFDTNTKLKTAVNLMPPKELRLEPLGRDRFGNAYWSALDEKSCALKIFQEHLDDETWQLVASSRDELVKLISNLSGDEQVIPSLIGIVDEDSSSNSIESYNLKQNEEKIKTKNEENCEENLIKTEKNKEIIAEVNNDEIVELKSNAETGNIIVKIKKNKTVAPNETKEDSEVDEEDEIDEEEEEGEEEEEIESDMSDIDEESEAGSMQTTTNKKEENQLQQNSRISLLASKRPSQKETMSKHSKKDPPETPEKKLKHEKLTLLKKNKTQDFDNESDDELEEEENDEEVEEEVSEEEDEEDDEVGEEIEEPIMVVKGEGTGEENQGTFLDCILNDDYVEYSDIIEEDVMYFNGEGLGDECTVGNKDNETNENGTHSNKSMFFFGQPGCLKLSPMKTASPSSSSIDEKVENTASSTDKDSKNINQTNIKRSLELDTNPKDLDGTDNQSESENKSKIENFKDILKPDTIKLTLSPDKIGNKSNTEKTKPLNINKDINKEIDTKLLDEKKSKVFTEKEADKTQTLISDVKLGSSSHNLDNKKDSLGDHSKSLDDNDKKNISKTKRDLGNENVLQSSTIDETTNIVSKDSFCPKVEHSLVKDIVFKSNDNLSSSVTNKTQSVETSLITANTVVSNKEKNKVQNVTQIESKCLKIHKESISDKIAVVVIKSNIELNQTQTEVKCQRTIENETKLVEKNVLAKSYKFSETKLDTETKVKESKIDVPENKIKNPDPTPDQFLVSSGSKLNPTHDLNKSKKCITDKVQIPQIMITVSEDQNENKSEDTELSSHLMAPSLLMDSRSNITESHSVLDKMQLASSEAIYSKLAKIAAAKGKSFSKIENTNTTVECLNIFENSVKQKTDNLTAVTKDCVNIIKDEMKEIPEKKTKSIESDVFTNAKTLNEIESKVDNGVNTKKNDSAPIAIAVESISTVLKETEKKEVNSNISKETATHKEHTTSIFQKKTKEPSTSILDNNSSASKITKLVTSEIKASPESKVAIKVDSDVESQLNMLKQPSEIVKTTIENTGITNKSKIASENTSISNKSEIELQKVSNESKHRIQLPKDKVSSKISNQDKISSSVIDNNEIKVKAMPIVNRSNDKETISVEISDTTSNVTETDVILANTTTLKDDSEENLNVDSVKTITSDKKPDTEMPFVAFESINKENTNIPDNTVNIKIPVTLEIDKAMEREIVNKSSGDELISTKHSTVENVTPNLTTKSTRTRNSKPKISNEETNLEKPKNVISEIAESEPKSLRSSRSKTSLSKLVDTVQKPQTSENAKKLLDGSNTSIKADCLKSNDDNLLKVKRGVQDLGDKDLVKISIQESDKISNTLKEGGQTIQNAGLKANDDTKSDLLLKEDPKAESLQSLSFDYDEKTDVNLAVQALNIAKTLSCQAKRKLSEEKDPLELETSSATPVSSKAKLADKRTPKKKRRLDVEPSLILEDEQEIETPVRQSRRIAQLKIKEEEERRKLEEMVLKQMKAESVKKKKEEQKKYKVEEIEEEPEEPEMDDPADGEYELKITDKKKLKKKKKDRPGSRPWQTSSGSSDSDDNEEEEEDGLEQEEDEELPALKSDHEFSPESDLENDMETIPTKRARTVKKEDDDFIDNPDHVCQKCGKHDHPEWILLCDSCDKGYHCSCLKPVLFIIPEGDWFCPPCQNLKLIESLKQHLEKYDQITKQMEEMEENKKRKQAAAMNVEKDLPEPKSEKRKYSRGRRNRKRRSIVEESESSLTDSDEEDDKDNDDSTSDDEPIYKLRKRRQDAVSYRFNEYDDLINSAIKRDMGDVGDTGEVANMENIVENDEDEFAGNLGRGKDISTIIEADQEEKQQKKLQDEDVKVKELNGDNEGKSEKIETDRLHKENNDNKEDIIPLKIVEQESKKIESDSDSEPIRPVVKRSFQSKFKKKSRKLNSLDIESDDDGSDEDFKGSSSDTEEDEDYSLSSASESSLDNKYSKKKKKRKTIARSVRRRRNDRTFINDNSDDSDAVVVRPRRKRAKKEESDFSDFDEDDEEDDEELDSADLCDSTTNESDSDSDGAWRPQNKSKKPTIKKKPIKTPVVKKKPVVQKKKGKHIDDDDDDDDDDDEDDDEDEEVSFKPATKKKKEISKADSDSGGETRRTRGKRTTYIEDYDDSSDDGIRPGVKRPDTPPEERERFIKKQEEIKRMLAAKNTDAAKVIATPVLAPIHNKDDINTDSISTVPRAVIQNAKVLDVDYNMRNKQSTDFVDDFDEELPEDFDPEDMDEEQIAKMMEEEDFAQQQLKLAGEAIRNKKIKEAEIQRKRDEERLREQTAVPVIQPLVNPYNAPASHINQENPQNEALKLTKNRFEDKKILPLIHSEGHFDINKDNRKLIPLSPTQALPTVPYTQLRPADPLMPPSIGPVPPIATAVPLRPVHTQGSVIMGIPNILHSPIIPPGSARLPIPGPIQALPPHHGMGIMPRSMAPPNVTVMPNSSVTSEPFIPTTILSVQKTVESSRSQTLEPSDNSPIKKRGRRKKITPLRDPSKPNPGLADLSMTSQQVKPEHLLDKKLGSVSGERLTGSPDHTPLTVAAPPQLFKPGSVPGSVITRLQQPQRPHVPSTFGQGHPRFYGPPLGPPPHHPLRPPFSGNPSSMSPSTDPNIPLSGHYIQPDNIRPPGNHLYGTHGYSAQNPLHHTLQPVTQAPSHVIRGPPPAREYPAGHPASFITCGFYPTPQQAVPANPVEEQPPPEPPFQQYEPLKSVPSQESETPPEPFVAPPAEEGSTTSEFSGLVSYFSSQQDDLDT